MTPNVSLFFSDILEDVSSGKVNSVRGLWGSSKALFLALLHARNPGRQLVLLPTPEAAEERFEDLQFYQQWFPDGIRICHFPSWETLPYDTFSPHSQIVHERMRTLHQLLDGDPCILVTSVPAVMQRLIPRDRFRRAILSLEVEMEMTMDRLLSHLVSTGYQSVSLVTQRGEFSRRGGIVDLYAPVEPYPIRLEFYGDWIESMRWFHPETQRTLPEADSPHRRSALVFPAIEMFGEGRSRSASGRGYGLSTERGPLETLFDYVDDSRQRPMRVVFDEVHEVRKRSRDFLEKVEESFASHEEQGERVPLPETLYLTQDELFPLPEGCDVLTLHRLPVVAPEQADLTGRPSVEIAYDRPLNPNQAIETLSLPLEISGIPRWDASRTRVVSLHAVEGFHLDPLTGPASHTGEKDFPLRATARKLESLRRDFFLILACTTEGQKQRVLELLHEYDTPAASPSPSEIGDLYGTPGVRPIMLLTGRISSGFVDPDHRLALFNDEEVFGKRLRGRASSSGHSAPTGHVRRSKRSSFASFEDLQSGDFVVHVQHGIGRYEGLRHLALDGGEGDFLLLRYAAGDSIYVPIDKLHLVQKYVGLEEGAPSLDRLGGARWAKTQGKVQKAVDEIAKDLVELYATRELTGGHAYSPDHTMLKELEATFEFEETPDQLTAIQNVKRDMERPRPMDHLVCGDVGFGKTEVAMRAAAKAVMDGKQVAVLVPTTLLAQQHYRTFSSRFVAFPVRVEMISRFRTHQEQVAVLKDLAEGRVDILIGTHRLLQKDIQFQDLGLVVVDEEQRFGVAQKERLKQLKKTVDVLTLTATPIPRTLQMGLSSIREMSVMETPPIDRLSIRTILAPFDRRIIREAILRELERSGQVYFVHNRVQSIHRIGSFLQELIPEARIGVAHGQMGEKLLENVMSQFVNHEKDILLTTAIIESGLDIPRANTILIDRADCFGLADLYQLRGRVGRSGHQAYAYLLISSEETLTDEAQKRLKAIQDLTELGSAFRLAMRDMEIRGAGNLLGKKQSGHIAAVGLDLYLEMMEKTVRFLRDEGTVQAPEVLDPTLNVKVSAFIPEAYLSDSRLRLTQYKRIASVMSEEEIHAIREEMVDRFGPVPAEVENLLQVMALKVLARQARVMKLERDGDQFFFTLDSKVVFTDHDVKRLMSRYPKNVRFLSEYTFEVRLARKWEESLDEVKTLLQALPQG